MTLNLTAKKIRSKGLTVKAWAAQHGYPYQTVIKVLHGYTGKRSASLALEILDRLRTDGFLEEAK